MNRAVRALSLILVFAALTAGAPYIRASAQDPQQDAKQAEAAAYKAWYDAYTAKDYGKALNLAKEYLTKFPSGGYAAYLKTWIPEARGILFGQAMQAKNTGEMITLGKEALAESPDEIDYLYLLSVRIREDEWFASPPNYSHEAELIDFTQRVIKLIEEGKAPSVVPKDKWRQNTALGYLYQTLAAIAQKETQTDKASDYYQKATTCDPSVAAYYLQWSSLLQDKYKAAREKYGAFPEEDRVHPEAKPEVQAAFDAANAAADALVDCWAHFLALTIKDNPFGETRGQIEKGLTDLYKYRHPGAPEGLQQLIEKYSKPPGSN